MSNENAKRCVDSFNSVYDFLFELAHDLKCEEDSAKISGNIDVEIASSKRRVQALHALRAMNRFAMDGDVALNTQSFLAIKTHALQYKLPATDTARQ
jgi:hypothetical protein